MKRNKRFAGALALGMLGISMLGTIPVHAENEGSWQSQETKAEQNSQMVVPVSVTQSGWEYPPYGTWKELNLKVNDTVYSLPKDKTVQIAVCDGDDICVLAGDSYVLWSGSVSMADETVSVTTEDNFSGYYLMEKDGSLTFTTRSFGGVFGKSSWMQYMRVAYDVTAETQTGVPLAGIRILDKENQMPGYLFGADYMSGGACIWGDGSSVTWNGKWNSEEEQLYTDWSAVAVTDETGYNDLIAVVEDNYYGEGEPLLAFAGGMIGCYFYDKSDDIFADNGLVDIIPSEWYGFYTLESMGISISPIVYETDEILGDCYKKADMTLGETSVTLEDALGTEIAEVTMGITGLSGAVTSVGNDSYFLGKDGVKMLPYAKVEMAEGTEDWTVEAVYDETFTNRLSSSEYSYADWFGGFRIRVVKNAETSALTQSIQKADVKLAKTSYIYNGTEKKPGVSVTLNGKTLVKDKDYTVSYQNNKNIGTATVTIKGKGAYTGTVSKNFEIQLPKGKTFTAGKYKYQVTGTSTVAFSGRKSSKTTKITIPKTVTYGGKTFEITEIAQEACKNNTNLTQVKIGAKVKTIGASAFSGCTKLSKVTMGSALTSIGNKAFYRCKAVKSITIPGNVTKLEKQAFYGCKNLKTITIQSKKLKTVGKEAFKNINSTAKIKVPKSKLSAYKKLLKGKGQGSKVQIVTYE